MIIGKKTADQFIQQVDSHTVENEKLLLKQLFAHFIDCPKETVLKALEAHKQKLMAKENRSQMENTILDVMDTVLNFMLL